MSLPVRAGCPSSWSVVTPIVEATSHNEPSEEQPTMSPVAAYYIFLAYENERELAWKQQPLRASRPSVMERARRLAAGLRTPRRTALSARG